MAHKAGFLDQGQFSCPICLDLLKDPVTIPCGHSYCMGCIKGYWDQDDHTGVYSCCPQCRQTFTPRPVLGRNTMLAEVVEKLKMIGLQAAPPAHSEAASGDRDVACDVCTGRKHKAIKSCLVCLASYCETHLQPHYQSPPLQKHKLVQATGNLQKNICFHHDKVLEIYCRTDQKCICYLCTIEDHRGHDTVSTITARTEKQKQMEVTHKKFQQSIQVKEKVLHNLRLAVESVKRSAQAAVEDSDRIFTELIRSIERRRSEVKGLIRDQQEAVVSQAEGRLQRLEQEIAELRRRDAELEQLSHTEDHIHFLQSCKSLCVAPGPGDLPSITVNPPLSFEAVRKTVSELKERLEDVCKGEMAKISRAGRGVGSYSCFTQTGGPQEAKPLQLKGETCPLCRGCFQKKQRLKCTHEFCAECLKISVDSLGLLCPVCHKPLSYIGDQPDGEMKWVEYWLSFRDRYYHITYLIQNGIQTGAHPNPGKPFVGIQASGYLPNTPEGKEVLRLLKRAFDQKLVFTVEATSEGADRVVYTDIPHSENLQKCYDPRFLEEVKAALRTKGIE